MARSFPGALTDYLTVGDNADVTGSLITVVARVKFTNLTGTQRYVAKFMSGNKSYMLQMTGSTVGCLVSDGTLDTLLAGATTLTAGRWYGVALRQWGSGATDLELLLDGKVDAVGQGKVLTNVTATLLFGQASGGTDAFNGELEDVAVWSDALSNTELTAVMKGQNPLKIRPQRLKGYWPLKEWGASGAATDVSPANLTATMVGTVGLTPGPNWTTGFARLDAGAIFETALDTQINTTIAAPFISSTTTLYAPYVVPGSPIFPPFIAPATTLYTHSISRNVAGVLLAATTVLYTPTVRRASIPAPLIASTTQVLPAHLARTLSNIGLPTISGVAQQGQTLVASPGTWSGTEPISYAYQWRRCDAAGAACANISGATASNYVVTAADVGSTIRIEVTASY